MYALVHSLCFNEHNIWATHDLRQLDLTRWRIIGQIKVKVKFLKRLQIFSVIYIYELALQLTTL
jgi:hypothetical protein